MVCVGSSALIGRAAAALVTPHRLPAATAQVGSAAPLVYSTASSRQPTTASIKQSFGRTCRKWQWQANCGVSCSEGTQNDWQQPPGSGCNSCSFFLCSKAPRDDKLKNVAAQWLLQSEYEMQSFHFSKKAFLQEEDF
ncbi:unnamed protein product [Ceratitis capitata]|uniref:(Mediterranean fruit fly) hypothetical protein n=1 Tax=Ceratitis capitata TaxID=7213 RepID=A0A811VB33_CERCA|nr:unnamed protein product [Ceratitis capitata]